MFQTEQSSVKWKKGRGNLGRLALDASMDTALGGWWVKTDRDATDERLSRDKFLALPLDSGGDAGRARVAVVRLRPATHCRRPAAAEQVLDYTPQENSDDAGEEDDEARSEEVEPVSRLHATVDVIAALRCHDNATARHLDQSRCGHNSTCCVWMCCGSVCGLTVRQVLQRSLEAADRDGVLLVCCRCRHGHSTEHSFN